MSNDLEAELDRADAMGDPRAFDRIRAALAYREDPQTPPTPSPRWNLRGSRGRRARKVRG
jgi:hypothetical protein